MPKKQTKVRKNRDIKKLTQEIKNGPVFENKGTTIVDLTTNKEVCEQITKSSCWRPDIYLDLGCSECSIQENCACPVKNLDKKKRLQRLKKND
jgi:hypothetical protein